MESVDPFDRLALLFRRLEVIGDVDTSNDEHAVVFADLAPNVRTQVSFTRIDSARLQRASKGTR